MPRVKRGPKRKRSRPPAFSWLALLRRLGGLGSSLGKRVVRALAPPSGLSLRSRQEIDALIAQMKTDAPRLAVLAAESWLAVEGVTRSLPRADMAALILAYCKTEGDTTRAAIANR